MWQKIPLGGLNQAKTMIFLDRERIHWQSLGIQSRVLRLSWWISRVQGMMPPNCRFNTKWSVVHICDISDGSVSILPWGWQTILGCPRVSVARFSPPCSRQAKRLGNLSYPRAPLHLPVKTDTESIVGEKNNPGPSNWGLSLNFIQCLRSFHTQQSFCRDEKKVFVVDLKSWNLARFADGIFIELVSTFREIRFSFIYKYPRPFH